MIRLGTIWVTCERQPLGHFLTAGRWKWTVLVGAEVYALTQLIYGIGFKIT